MFIEDKIKRHEVQKETKSLGNREYGHKKGSNVDDQKESGNKIVNVDKRKVRKEGQRRVRKRKEGKRKRKRRKK